MSDVGDTIRVLYAEDDVPFAEVTVNYLENVDERLAVDTVESAGEGETRLADGTYDCIVSDYQMPGKDGIEFLETVRESYPDIPFILFTGQGSETVASEAISAGVTDYLQKRSTSEQYELLATRIDNGVTQYRAEQELERKNDLFERTQALGGVGVWEWYPQTDEGYYSSEVYTIYGIEDRDDRSPDTDIRDFYHPDDRETVRNAFQRAVERGESYDIEVRVIDADDEQKWVRTRGDPQFENGQCVRIRGTIQDITKTKQMRARLNAYVDNASDVLGIISGDGVFLDLSQSTEDVLLYEPAELEGDDIFDHIHPDDETRVAQAFWELVESDSRDTQRVRYRFRRGDGSWVWLESVASDRTETPLEGYVVTTREITEQKEREQELERASDLLKQTERIADVGGWELDAEFDDVYWTDNTFSLMGVDDDNAPTLEDAYGVYHPDDRPMIQDAVQTALDSGESFDIEARFQRETEDTGWLRVQGTPKYDGDSVTQLRGAIQDITERRNREAVLRKMYDIIADQEQSFEQQVQSLLGLGRSELNTKYATLSRIQGDKYLFECVDAADDSIEAGDVASVSATNCETAAHTEETLVLGDVARDAPEETDRVGYTEWGISCYLGAPVFIDDEVYGTFCFYGTETRPAFSDWEETLVDLMSGWVSYELERRQTNEELKETNEQLEQFASVLSHDLRNPLNVAELQTDLAKRECDSEHLDDVEGALDRMNTMIEDLLTLTRGGEVDLEPEPIDIATVTENCWTTVKTSGASVEATTDRTVEADDRRLKQIFENIFRNAVEHAGPDVTVTVGTLEDGIYIEDDGPGIDETSRERIFEGGYSTSEDGTGLGMSIVKQAAEAHGWEVAVTEGTDGGARFEFTGVTFAD